MKLKDVNNDGEELIKSKSQDGSRLRSQKDQFMVEKQKDRFDLRSLFIKDNYLKVFI